MPQLCTVNVGIYIFFDENVFGSVSGEITQGAHLVIIGYPVFILL